MPPERPPVLLLVDIVERADAIEAANFVVHAYERVDASILEVTARERVPRFRSEVFSILEVKFPLVAKALAERRAQEDR